MGFRSTIISQHYTGDLPEWFKGKYSNSLQFPGGTLIASKRECKYYDNELFEDYQKALIEIGVLNSDCLSVGVAVLGEDNFISRVLIKKDGIIYSWLTDDYERSRVWCQG
jgi:hypothetical protein